MMALSRKKLSLYALHPTNAQSSHPRSEASPDTVSGELTCRARLLVTKVLAASKNADPITTPWIVFVKTSVFSPERRELLCG
jgi:hypothetical protein